MPASIVLESMLPRSRQQLADAGTHAVRKAGDSTACRKDRLGMTGDDCESFAEILDQLDPRGGSGKFHFIAGKEEASTAGSFLVCREPPAERSNRVIPDKPPVIEGETPCRCNETEGNWLPWDRSGKRHQETQ